MISDTERREAARKLRNAEERTMMELTDGELLDLLADAVDLDMAVKVGEVDKVEMMRRAKALAKADSEARGVE